MTSKKCRSILVWCLLVYLFLLLLYTYNVIFPNYSLNRRKNKRTLLELTVKLNKIAESHSELKNAEVDEKLKFYSNDRVKNIGLTIDDGVSSNELIFINGLIKYDETKMKNTKKNELIYETRQEMFHPISNNNKLEISNNNKLEIEERMKTMEINKKINREGKKYIFALRFYEQLSMATKNLLSLISLGTHTSRYVVRPFVNNSRFCGLRTGVSMSRYMETQSNNINKFNDFSTYFDINHFNYKLSDRGYTPLVSFNQFKKDCPRLDTVVHFLYKEESSRKEMAKWYKLSEEKINEVKRMVKENNGVAECRFVQKSRISLLLGNINVTRYLCVDPEIITSAEELERRVLRNGSCVGFIMWKGSGPKRTHFALAPTIQIPLRPSNLKHSKRLIDIAYSYIREVIKRPFIAVHVRSERHLTRKGLKAIKSCIKKLTNSVLNRKSLFNLQKIFLASDLVQHGSDTLLMHSNATERKLLRKELSAILGNPCTFNPVAYNLYDRGEIAIVEMHILSMGESLFTLGRGNFQEWVMDLFLLHNAEDKSLIYKVCDIFD